ncbi:MAG: translational GTPase TypA [Saprospiraceae bacterium]|nr:translational GTPase TypA [Saprospiraceae bacterium]
MQEIRNIAIIAHVDHGKTTLVDKIFHQTNLFRENEDMGDLILDNNDLERERGITITSKNVSVRYKGVKINIIDTPGHADFGGEVERVLKMADGVVLLVDAFEGPMPQTRFVTQKMVDLGLKPMVVINKVDKENCRPDEVQEAVYELFFNLDASEDQLEFRTLYGSSKHGWMGDDWKTPTADITPLLDAILEEIPAAKSPEGTVQMQVTTIDHNNYQGRIAIGRVSRGTLKENTPITLIKQSGGVIKTRIKELHVFEGLGRARVQEVRAGEIAAVIGLEDFQIGDTIADFENPEGLPSISIGEPTMNMLFTINNSPFFGKEGKFVNSRQIRDRLYKETEKNLALRVEETESPDALLVFGRGILHLSILIETMRREGYELQVGQPRVIIKEIDGVKNEPFETLSIDVPEPVSGKVIELVTQRKGDMMIMEPKGDLIHMEFLMPSRGIIGLRNKILTATAGEAIMNHQFDSFQPLKADLPRRLNGVLVSSDTGAAMAYAINKLQERGRFFIDPGEQVYEGQILGENTRDNDIVINVVKGKNLTNMRASGKDDGTKIAPAVKFSLEEALEYIQDDEYVEITPKSMRLRKIRLTESDRKKAANKALANIKW